MKIGSHKFDYLKIELRYFDAKVAELLVSDIFRACAGGWDRNGFLDRESCVLSWAGFFPSLLKATRSALLKEWKTWELVFLVPHDIHICAEQLLKATKSPFVFLANKGFLKAPEKWMATQDSRNGGLYPLYNDAVTTEIIYATKSNK